MKIELLFLTTIQSNNNVLKKKIKILISISALAFLISSCASICVVPQQKISIDGHEILFAESKIPCKKVKDFNMAVEQVVKAIYSDEFENRLTSYIKDSIGIGEHAKAWEGLNATDIVYKMRVQINGTYADTYGGVKGLWLFVFSHNIAFDGTESGPILLNRIPLKKRTAGSIANTIAHEVSHRIGLTHPHSDLNLKIAYKEPPYIIGDIIEDIIKKIN